FHVQPAQPKLLREAAWPQQRRRTFAQGGDELSSANRKQLFPAPQPAATPGDRLFVQAVSRAVEVVARKEGPTVRGISAAELVGTVAIFRERAFEEGERRCSGVARTHRRRLDEAPSLGAITRGRDGALRRSFRLSLEIAILALESRSQTCAPRP